MGSDWDRYWGELDDELDKPESQRYEAIRKFAEYLALAIHEREMRIIDGLPGGGEE